MQYTRKLKINQNQTNYEIKAKRPSEGNPKNADETEQKKT